LKEVARIEGLLCCHFLAVLVQALVERQIRRAMAATVVTSIPLYPQDRERGAPSAPRIFDIFSGLARHELTSGGRVVQTFAAELTSSRPKSSICSKCPRPPTSHHEIDAETCGKRDGWVARAAYRVGRLWRVCPADILASRGV